jgi:hypothetical protein
LKTLNFIRGYGLVGDLPVILVLFFLIGVKIL